MHQGFSRCCPAAVGAEAGSACSHGAGLAPVPRVTGTALCTQTCAGSTWAEGGQDPSRGVGPFLGFHHLRRWMLSGGAGPGVLNAAVKRNRTLFLTNKQKTPLILEKRFIIT